MDSESPVPTSSEGFLKVPLQHASQIDRAQRAALIRKGNELFNNGNHEAAKRVFVTVRYSDGLIRLGNQHMKRGEPLEAFRMFYLAGDKRRVDELAEQMAGVVRKWLREDIR